MWRSQQPDPGGDDGFDDRFVLLDTTFGGAGCVRGDLTPECAAAVQAVLESLGKPRGPEDTRTQAQRYHDALQEGCELLLRARMVPDRADAEAAACDALIVPVVTGHPDMAVIDQILEVCTPTAPPKSAAPTARSSEATTRPRSERDNPAAPSGYV